MGMGEALKTCMRKYADFGGRGRRSEYWWFSLVHQLIMFPFIAAFIVAEVAFFVSLDSRSDYDGTVHYSGGNIGPMLAVFAVMMIASLAFILPSYAAMVRRLHDMGQSGLWVLLNFAGFGIVPVVMCIMDTQPGTNQWGPDPKAAERVGFGYPPSPGYPPAYPTTSPPGT